jgi:hypothetical protein
MVEPWTWLRTLYIKGNRYLLRTVTLLSPQYLIHKRRPRPCALGTIWIGAPARDLEGFKSSDR